MPFNVTIILRDKRANDVGKHRVAARTEHDDEARGIAVDRVQKHFSAHPDGYVELVFEERTRYAFYFQQAESFILGAL